MIIRLANRTYYLSLKKVVAVVCAVLLAVWSLGPILTVIWMSLMRDVELYATPPHWIPRNPTLFNYINIFGLLSEEEVTKYTVMSGQGEMLRKGVMNSLIVAAATTLIAIFISSLGGYIFGRYRFRFKNSLLMTILMTRALPPISVIAPYFFLFVSWGLAGTQLGLIIIYLSSLTPLFTWVLLGFFATLPVETERAARVDGCSRLKTFFRVMIPIAAPGIAATGILGFLMCWNEFLYALIVTGGSDAQTLQPSISGLFTQNTEFSQMAAVAVLSMIPCALAAFIFQKYITQLKIVDPVTVIEVE